MSDHFDDFDDDYWTAQAMKTYGGSFVQTLGGAMLRADWRNLERLRGAFPEYFSKYAVMGVKLKEEAR